MDDLIVDIKLWGKMVGSLVWDNAAGMAVFEYDNNFRRNGIEPAPLTMHYLWEIALSLFPQIEQTVLKVYQD